MDSFNIHNYFKRGKTVVLTLRHGEEEIRQWADKDIADLLKLMRAFHTEFQNPRRKKKEVWDDVSSELHKAGYTWSSEDCRKKWSNMIRTLKGIEEQKHDPSYTNKRLKWPFYDSMIQLLTLENSEALPEASSVIQLLNGDPNRASGSSSFARKTNNYKPLESFPKFTVHHHHRPAIDNVQNASQFLEPQRDGDDTINLVSEADLMEMGVALEGHHDQLTAEIQAVAGEAGLLFVQQQQPSRPDVILPSTSSTSNSFLSTVNKASLSVRTKKRPLKRKRTGKDRKAEESIETMLSKFVESTTKQNQQMLEKITSFHENAIGLMHERNEILREIRDSLHEVDPCENLVGACHNADDNEEPQNTLTLHVGPAFSINSPNEHNSSNTHLSSALVIANPGATSTLSTFQLEDGTVLSSIGATQDKDVLSNLGSYAQSVLPTVSLLHPSLSVVTDGGGTSSEEIALTMQNTVCTGKSEINTE